MPVSEAVELALIDKIPAVASAVASCVAAVASTIAVYYARTAVKISKQTEENTNHLKDELVAVVSKERFAAGAKEARDEAGARALLDLGNKP